jgi:SNF2 family DNA or RNA helicase
MPKEIHDMIVQSEARCGPKIETVLQMIRKSTEKFIVFTQFHSVMTLLCETLKNNGIPFVSIEGRMSPQKRSKSIAKFQTDNDTRVFVMTTKTASVGITLTAGSQIIFLEPCNDEGLRKQAIGRAWRIGQTRPVHVTTLRVEGTIDCIDTNLIHYIRGGANQ